MRRFIDLRGAETEAQRLHFSYRYWLAEMDGPLAIAALAIEASRLAAPYRLRRRIAQRAVQFFRRNGAAVIVKSQDRKNRPRMGGRPPVAVGELQLRRGGKVGVDFLREAGGDLLAQGAIDGEIGLEFRQGAFPAQSEADIGQG